MKIKDIIKISATMLSMDNVVGHLNDENTNADTLTLREINVFVTLFNSMVSELAGTYIPMKKTEKFNGETEIFFNSLTENAVKIVDVLNEEKQSVSYTQTAEKIKINEGCYYLVYEYIPSNYGIEDTIGYTFKDVSKTVLAYGLCSEYLIHLARYSEAMVFHEKYVNGIKSLKKIKNGKTVKRLWK